MKYIYDYFSLFATVLWPLPLSIYIFIIATLILLLCIFIKKSMKKSRLITAALLSIWIISVIPQFIDLPTIYTKPDLDISFIQQQELQKSDEILKKLIELSNLFLFEKVTDRNFSTSTGIPYNKDGFVYFYRNTQASSLETGLNIELYYYDSNDNAKKSYGSFKKMLNNKELYISNDSGNLDYMQTKNKMFWDISDVGRYSGGTNSYSFIRYDNLLFIIIKSDNASTTKANHSIKLLSNLILKV